MLFIEEILTSVDEGDDEELEENEDETPEDEEEI
ncbi:MAG: hypothetical protein UT31_C0007G0008 [Parcubacteria group bacterium GW2011_GWF2_39_13b]|nr:MAG: hypothetical protein UT31_C0007G0008 [Parcubacteria group bacterium GW2011_GWF2_39_13b]